MSRFVVSADVSRSFLKLLAQRKDRTRIAIITWQALRAHEHQSRLPTRRTHQLDSRDKCDVLDAYAEIDFRTLTNSTTNLLDTHTAPRALYRRAAAAAAAAGPLPHRGWPPPVPPPLLVRAKARAFADAAASHPPAAAEHHHHHHHHAVAEEEEVGGGLRCCSCCSPPPSDDCGCYAAQLQQRAAQARRRQSGGGLQKTESMARGWGAKWGHISMGG